VRGYFFVISFLFGKGWPIKQKKAGTVDVPAFLMIV
jgi:hypothetical protein